MDKNPIQFAVVREDPALEIDLIHRCGAKNILMIASGGCTALSLQSHFPNLKQTLLDPNQAQLELVQRKMDAVLKGGGNELWNIESETSQGLNQCGNFESLFRCLRSFINEFVFTHDELHQHFSKPYFQAASFQSPYWREAMELFFQDSLLVTMFGPDAVQHGAAGSYAEYFRTIFERGLLREDAPDNYFLHHIFLGYYLDRAKPDYLQQPPKSLNIDLRQGLAIDIDNLAHYDIVQLSNIFDWMDDTAIEEIAKRVNQEMKPGSHLLFRQLNNTRNLESKFPGFEFDNDWAQLWQQKDRSLFYNKINLGKKI